MKKSKIILTIFNCIMFVICMVGVYHCFEADRTIWAIAFIFNSIMNLISAFMNIYEKTLRKAGIIE